MAVFYNSGKAVSNTNTKKQNQRNVSLTYIIN